jgi:hypothetical protein
MLDLAHGDTVDQFFAGTHEASAGRPEAAVLNASQPATPAQLPSIASAAAAPLNNVSDRDAPAPLSFAAKIQSTDSTTIGSTQHSVLNDNVGAVASAWKKGQQGQREEQQPETPDAPVPANTQAAPAFNPISTVAPSANPQIPVFIPKPAEVTTSPTKVLDALAPMQPTQAPATGQLKDLSFRVAQEDGSSVQLRLTQQSGELKLAVHTASPDLNQGLRDSLPDLTRKLSDTGFHAETWRPGVSATPASSEGDAARNSGGNAQGGNSQNQSGSGQQQGNPRRDQNQAFRPQWVDEFENGIQSTSSFPLTGDIHGFVS